MGDTLFGPDDAFREIRANATEALADRSDEIPFATDEQLAHWLKHARSEVVTIRARADIALEDIDRVLHILDPRSPST